MANGSVLPRESGISQRPMKNAVKFQSPASMEVEMKLPYAGLGVGDVGNIVLRDRQRLAEDGIIIVVMTLESGSGQVLAGPDIVSRGFVYVRNSESLMDEAKTVLDHTMEYCIDHNITDWGKIKNEVKDALGDFVWKETKRRPMIMPIIMEV